MATPVSSTHLAEWESAEQLRSAAEARKADRLRCQVTRYLDPPADTPYSLEFAYHLLGDVRGKRILDLGCGSGETTVVLATRGARVAGLDLSPELIELAEKRLIDHRVTAELRTGSAYSTGLERESVDIVFAISILHHLDLERAREEIWRVLRPGGLLILREPVRDSRTLAYVRKLVPSRGEEVSPYERPLRRSELENLARDFKIMAARRFRLPFIRIVKQVVPRWEKKAWRIDGWLLHHVKPLRRYATVQVMSLQKQS
jgi:2-polyprenyl-3-methyl-5-hydroxy-6-metoxy-1,4-benzoquinol methylase